MRTGVVKKWNTRGFGFIKPEDGGHDVFVHVTQIPERLDRLKEGERVKFDEEISKRTGKNQAVRVELA